ncbi:MAG: HAMP domain-containing sensor histidine kinase [Planctomycetota bacterium]
MHDPIARPSTPTRRRVRSQMDHHDDALLTKDQGLKRRTKTPRSGVISDSTDAALRLLSETSHDLRSPLSSVSATLELMRDGQLGDLSQSQLDLIQKAIGQCDYMTSMVDGLTHANRLKHGNPPIQRRTVTYREVQRSVTDATSASLENYDIELLFDGFDGPETRLFADPAILTRLLVNAVVNAQRAIAAAAGAAHRTILIRVEGNHDRGIAAFSVIDSGSGISPSKLKRLAAQDGPASAAMPGLIDGGEGLGLMISRQLAGLLLTSLRLRSQPGRGTEVMFEVPLDHPVAIASAFARHRDRFRGPHAAIRPMGQAAPSMTVHTHPTSVPAWTAELDFQGTHPRRSDRLAIGMVTMSSSCPRESADSFDRIAQVGLNPFELTVRTARRQWVWALDADAHTIEDRLQSIDQRAHETIDGVDIDWSQPAITSTRRRVLQATLADRITTATLAAVASGPGLQDEVRLGTAPLDASPVATVRLDEELRRLSRRMKQQATRLQQQSSALRP